MLSPMPDQRPLSSQISFGLKRGKEELLADAVHLFADDADDLVDRAVAEKR